MGFEGRVEVSSEIFLRTFQYFNTVRQKTFAASLFTDNFTVAFLQGPWRYREFLTEG